MVRRPAARDEGNMDIEPAAIRYDEDLYPESDGPLIFESDRHRAEATALIDMLQDRYRDRADVYVGGNLFFYYEEGHPEAVFAPDVFVVFGVPKRERRVYKIWEEGVPPTVVFELSSRSTWREDARSRRARFARLGVAECFLCDPMYEYLDPPLQGFRLTEGGYETMPTGADGWLTSDQLGLRLRLEASRLQLEDAVTGERLLRSAEVRALLRARG
jgi:Uma2 family endonuclease